MTKRSNVTLRLVSLAIVVVLLATGLFSITGYADEPAATSEQGSTVTTKVTLKGEPAKGVIVRLSGKGASTHTSVTTDSTGAATFKNVADGANYSFIVLPKAGSYARYQSEHFSVPGTVPDIELEAGHSVTTRVTLKGAPVVGVKVSLDAGLYYSITASTDSDGFVTFPNVPSWGEGHFGVSRSASGAYASYCGMALEKTFQIPSASYPEIELSAGKSITAKVTLNGVPQARATVTLVQVEPINKEDKDRNNVTYGPVKTDESGKASFENIGSGVYYFKAADASGLYHINYEYEEGEFTFPGIVPDIVLNPDYKPALPVNPVIPGNPVSRPFSNGGGSYAIGGRGSYMPSRLAVAAPAHTLTKGDGYYDTILSGAIQTRLYANWPVMGYTTGTDADKMCAVFEKWFSNKLRAIHFAREGRWEQPVKVAAKIDLTGVDVTKLVLYYYDSIANTYGRITDTQYWVDANGFLHFTTEYAGEVIISEGELAGR